MPERTDPQAKRLLEQYLRDVRSLPNEAARRDRFTTLVGELFPASAIITRISAGVERAIRIQLPERLRSGRIDSYFGNSVIEFERSLSAAGSAAEQQLREYCSGIWAEEGRPYRPLVAIATDGVVWRAFRPSLSAEVSRTPMPGDVSLELLRELTVTESNLYEFYLWLNGLLFRAGQIVPSGEQFNRDFGKGSLAYAEASAALTEAWRRVR